MKTTCHCESDPGAGRCGKEEVRSTYALWDHAASHSELEEAL